MSGGVLARYADWPQPFRLLELPDPQLAVSVAIDENEDVARVSVSVERPAKGVFLTVDETDTGALGRKEGVRWSDNALDVLPGDPQVIKAYGLRGKRARMRVAYLGCEKGKVVYEQ